MPIAYIGLGSNLGDRLTNLREAVNRLLDEPAIVPDGDSAVAAIYETSPVGMATSTLPFLNSVIRVRCTVSPRHILDRLLAIESSMGRVRAPTGVSQTTATASRIIDLDLLMFDDLVVAEPGLTVPHSRIPERRFVLEPLSEVAADSVHPTLGVPISALAVAARSERTEQAVTRLYGPNWCDLSGWVPHPRSREGGGWIVAEGA